MIKKDTNKVCLLFLFIMKLTTQSINRVVKLILPAEASRLELVNGVP